ncbi:MAG: DNA-directed RNA polymerase subunit alpha [Synergistaceae bacterium]|nr:DNA-directed RNA polymerase subunit alpha [Synergistaceae bacterium]
MENTKFKVYIDEKTQDYGRIYIEPLERGYGDTLGNALRRLLLSSIKGAAVTAVRIDGILHEFSTIKGVREDVIEILMNLKHIPIKARNSKPETVSEGYKIITLDSDDLPKDFFTRAENPGVITAKDMPWDNDFEFCGDGVLCSLEPKAHILMEIYVEEGVGYLSAERERPANPPLPVDAMLADAIFSPVKRVNYTIQPARVGQSIDYERLIIEVWTNGAVTPEEAVSEAARIAEDCFGHIANTVETAPQAEIPKDDPVAEELVPEEKREDKNTENFTHPIHELELSIRSENCLLRGGIQTVGELLQKSRDDLLKIRNLGKISLKEIEARLQALGYELKPSEPQQEASAENQPESDGETEPESESAEESETESESPEE